jgi:hypothetical protein
VPFEGQVILLLQIGHREGRIVAIEACVHRKEGPASTSLRTAVSSRSTNVADIEAPTKTFSE